ncbi:MAG: hypothetical protein LQ349_001123 [Xanthoria aureola]|nr:MAG: hypothetical protein LQ349_001123 [Xanthoria aureola]
MYQFEFSDRPNPAPYTLLLFLPEREIPDEFYLSELREANFERPNFHRYRIHMDVDGRWVARVWQIVLETPEPRHPLPRPHRPMKARKPQEAIAKKVKVGLPSRNQTKASGRQLYRDSTVQHQREFYDAFMTQCAKRKSCFLLVLSHHHPIGDFALCPYQWNDQEQRQWMLWKTPPKTISDLPGVPDVVPICYYTRDLEINLDGPALTAAQFRRLNSCNNGRLLIWNLWGSDETTRLCPLVVIPSEDLGVTVAQRELFAHNLKVDHMEEYQQRTPTISKILHTGLIASDYIVGRQGPGIFDGDDYGSVWEFFSQFTRLPRLQHPAGFMRDPAAYRCSLREIHRRLLQEHRRHTLGMIVEPEL